MKNNDGTQKAEAKTRIQGQYCLLRRLQDSPSYMARSLQKQNKQHQQQKKNLTNKRCPK